MSLISKLFGRNTVNLAIKFHKEANDFAEHGTLYASHVGFGLENEAVRFVFVGLDTPPALTPEIYAFIWDRAEAAGFKPSSLRSYIGVNTTVVHQGALSPIMGVPGGAARKLPNRERSEDLSRAVSRDYLNGLAGGSLQKATQSVMHERDDFGFPIKSN